MAVDKLVDSTQLDSDLTSVANAIRAKSGGSSQLAFPAGFVSEIQAIPSGGGGDYVANDWLDASKPTGELSSNTAFNLNSPPLLKKHTGITKVSLPEATAVPHDFFTNCTGLASVYLPKATEVGSSGLYGCTSLVYLVLPKGQLGKSLNAANCSNLLAIDMLGGITNSNCCSGNAKMNNLVIRGSTVQALSAVGALSNTPFASGKAGGTLYVPNDLISGYQSASNWSTILGYPNNQIKSIESTHTDPTAPVDLTTHYIDGTLIPT